jgi:tetratricopeptide (TPR) repeat protein
MIKNDEKTISECLESVNGLIDSASISSFGSTDKTMSIVKKFLKSNKIPAKFYQHESKTLLQNQTLAIKEAKKTVQTLGLSLPDSYFLFLKADQKICDHSTIPRETLSEDGYLALEQSTALAYYSYQPNFIRASLPENRIVAWRQTGTSSQGQPLHKMRSLKIEDLSGEKKEYLEETNNALKKETRKKSIDFFTQAIHEAPDNTRYYLYLAQSYKSLQLYPEAIACFQTRINKNGDQEELWFSKYMIGECYEALGKWPDALFWYLDAYQHNPRRSEPIKKVSSHYRHSGQNELAYLFAKHGIQIPFSEQSTLFPLPALYDYQFDEDISIAAYYTQFKEDGYTAANDLLLRREIPYGIKNQSYNNILFYVKPLNGSYAPIQISLPYIRGSSEKRYNPTNPSIVKTKDGYKLICRSVNYTQLGAKHYHTDDSEGIFHTRNFLIYYDASFTKLSQHEIIEDIPRQRRHGSSDHGLEDCRVIEENQTTWFCCTTLDSNRTGAYQVSLAQLENKPVVDEQPIRVKTLTPLEGPDIYRHEKNWLPFLKEGEIHFVYNSDPFVIYKPNKKTGVCEKTLDYVPEYDFSRFRGSAAPIEFDGGYLMLVHEVVMQSDDSRIYLHRFVNLDSNFKITQVSKPFIFKQQGVEFCLSMVIDHAGKSLILPIGIEDREAWIVTVPLEEIRSLLGPLPNIYPPF